MASEAFSVASEVIAFLNYLRNEIHPRQSINRQDVIRTLLYQCRSNFPGYNAVIAELGCANFSFIQPNDKLIDEDFERQDLMSKFKFKLVVFKKGSVSIIHGINDVKKWGILFSILYTKKIESCQC